MTQTNMNPEWPPILQRYVKEHQPVSAEHQPRRVLRRFHGVDVSLWQGFGHVNDIDGYVENIRLRYFLNKWKSKQRVDRDPTSDEIYEIMIEADREEDQDKKKPFHVDRMAENIQRNGVQEPVIVFYRTGGPAELWDGNRRFYGSKHIMKDPAFSAKDRERLCWLPVQVVLPSGDPAQDERIKHSILTECNFVEKDHIPWPAYVKAEEIHRKFQKRCPDPTDTVRSREVKDELAVEYGLKGWRVADRWIKMYDLALQFKEYHEEEHARPGVDVDLLIQERFEYFDELSKPGVWGAVKSDLEARDEVFQWLYDGKFQAFPDVRLVPKILEDPVARRQANEGGVNGVREAIKTIYANDSTRNKSKEAANEKIRQFAEWIDSFKREDYRRLEPATLTTLRTILQDVVKMLEGLVGGGPVPPAAPPTSTNEDAA
jgi:hypothetical protein